MQLKPLYARGFRFERGFRIAHPIAKRIGKLLLPRMLGTTVYQLSVLIDTVLASLAWIVGKGGVAALYYSNRLVQLPLAIFGIALATAALPKMSKEVATKDMDKLKNTVSFSLKTVFTIMIPASLGLMILARPIIRILFERGEFTSYSTFITSNALFFYTFGLFAYAGIKILVSTYYYMGDTKTPVKTASVSLVINLVLNLILMWPLKIGGLALATSIAATYNFIALYVILTRRIGDVGTSSILSSFARICTAAGVMAVFTFFISHALLQPAEIAGIRGFAGILLTILASGIVYLVTAYIVGVEGVRRLYGAALEKIRS
jgi:putative peptidoglycan lipid II flippase